MKRINDYLIKPLWCERIFEFEVRMSGLIKVYTTYYYFRYNTTKTNFNLMDIGARCEKLVNNISEEHNQVYEFIIFDSTPTEIKRIFLDLDKYVEVS